MKKFPSVHLPDLTLFFTSINIVIHAEKIKKKFCLNHAMMNLHYMIYVGIIEMINNHENYL